MDEVHEHGTPRTIVSAERRAVGIPVGLRLLDEVDARVLVYCVNVSDEQSLATRTTRIDVQVARTINECELLEFSRQMLE